MSYEEPKACSGRFFVRAGWLLDGTGHPIERDRWVEVDAGRIVSIRKDADALGEGVPVLDASRSLMLPGLVDAHVHLAWSETPDPEKRRRQFYAPLEESRERILRHVRSHLEWGVVIVRDGGDHHGHVLRYKLENPLEGNPGVRIRAAGRAIYKDGRYGAIIGSPVSENGLCDAARDRIEAGADHVKIVQSGLNSLKTFAEPTAPQFSLEALQSLVHTAHRRGKRVMVHANSPEPVRLAVLSGCDSIEHGFFMGPENLSLMAERGVVWVPTAVTMKKLAETLGESSPEGEMARRNLAHQMEQMALARKLWVRVVTGTDAGGVGVSHGPSLYDEMGILMEAGFDLSGAVRCATSNAARLLGIPEGGAIQPGALATFILMPGPPEKWKNAFPEPEALFLEGIRWQKEKAPAPFKTQAPEASTRHPPR